MSKKIIDRYCREVSWQLFCLPETKRELLRGLREELEELSPEHTESLEKIEIHYGKLPQTAVALQEVVSAGERSMALKRQRRRRRIIALAACVSITLLIALIIYLCCSAPFVYIYLK